MVKNPLKGLKIAYTDGFSLDFQTKIKGWIKHHGGMVADPDAPDLTHLIVSKAARKRTPQHGDTISQVRNRKTCFIVNLEWLKDSITKQKCLDVTTRDSMGKPYAFEKRHAIKVQATLRELHGLAKRERRRQERNAAYDGDGEESETPRHDPKLKLSKYVVAFEQERKQEGYRPYIDEEGCVYFICLLRQIPGTNCTEQYNLTIHRRDPVLSPPQDTSDETQQDERAPQANIVGETSKAPTFRVMCQFLKSKGRSMVYESDELAAGDIDKCLAKFSKFFQLKTGLEFDRTKTEAISPVGEALLSFVEDADKFRCERSSAYVAALGKRYEREVHEQWLETTASRVFIT